MKSKSNKLDQIASGSWHAGKPGTPVDIAAWDAGPPWARIFVVVD